MEILESKLSGNYNSGNITSKQIEIAVLVPCLNEGLTIAKVIEDFKKNLPKAKIYVYDNDSTDDTIEKASEAGAIVEKETRKGKANVVLRMFREVQADYYILVDGDDTYPAESAPEMINVMIETNSDMVVGDRLSNTSYENENKRKFHNFGNNLIKKLINKFYGADIKDVLTGYRVFNNKFVKNYVSTIKGFELETDLTIYCLNYDFKIAQVQVDYRDRPEGSSSKLNTFTDGFKVIKLFFNLYRLYKPFNFFGILAIVFFVIGLILGAFPISEYFLNENHYIHKVPTAIAAVSMVIIAILLFCCGLILDNLAKIDIKHFKHLLLHYDQRK